MKRLIFILLLLVTCIYVDARMIKVFTGKYSSDSYYDVWMPQKLKVEGVITFFHGLGEETLSLADFQNPKIGPYKTGLAAMLLDTLEYPYTIIIPQLRTRAGDWPPSVARALFPIIDAYSGNGTLPRHVTGLSLGGIMVHLVVREALVFNEGRPGYFTTAGAVCGRTNDTATAAYLGNLKLKLWHGEKDTVVPIGADKILFKRLQLFMKDNISYVWYAEDGHGIWNKVYSTEYFQFVKDNTPKPYVPILDNLTKMAVLDEEFLYIETAKGGYKVPLIKLPK